MEETKQERSKEEVPEGLDPTVGTLDYPLDAVFVRTEPRTVGDVVRRIRNDRYILNPDFQRDFVWPAVKQSRLIESCLMRIPLPVFYVAEAPDGRIIVVDGLQRLTTFRNYLDGDFALTGLTRATSESKELSPFEGLKFDELPLNLRERIEDTQLTLYILDSKAPERAKLDIFERVNGGVPLTRQQMRNCLYNGPATQWLRDASDLPLFLVATGGSLDRKSMRDREAINRFSGFQLLGSEVYRGDMDGFLAQALQFINEDLEGNTDSLMRDFCRSMKANSFLFGPHAFRKSLASPDSGRSVINISLFDVCSVLMAGLADAQVEAQAEKLRAAFQSLIKDPVFSNAITYSTNSTRQVETRFYMARTAVSGALT